MNNLRERLVKMASMLSYLEPGSAGKLPAGLAGYTKRTRIQPPVLHVKHPGRSIEEAVGERLQALHAKGEGTYEELYARGPELIADMQRSIRAMTTRAERLRTRAVVGKSEEIMPRFGESDAAFDKRRYGNPAEAAPISGASPGKTPSWENFVNNIRAHPIKVPAKLIGGGLAGAALANVLGHLGNPRITLLDLARKHPLAATGIVGGTGLAGLAAFKKKQEK